jgi:osmotically-inducible protein OsmY
MTMTIRARRTKEPVRRFDLGRLIGREPADRSDVVNVREIQDRAGEVQTRIGEGLSTLGANIASVTDDVAKAGRATLEDLRERLPERPSLDQVPRIRIERRPTMAQRVRGALGTGLLAALAVGVGALLAFMLDPARGRSRRAYARDRAAATARRTARTLGRTGRVVGANVAGLRQKAANMGATGEVPNDATLAHKVESVLFRDPGVDKGRINVNAEDGVVVLRGVAESTDQIRTLEERVRDIDGVEDVENLLHLPGTPAPPDAARYAVGAAAASRPVEMAGVNGNDGGEPRS